MILLAEGEGFPPEAGRRTHGTLRHIRFLPHKRDYDLLLKILRSLEFLDKSVTSERTLSSFRESQGNALSYKAEAGGFEPPKPVKAYPLSKRTH